MPNMHFLPCVIVGEDREVLILKEKYKSDSVALARFIRAYTTPS